MNRVVAVLLLIMMSCKKDGDKAQTIPLKVTEPKTGSPVINAKVILFRCEGNFGCWDTPSFFDGTTDENGICKVPLLEFKEPSTHVYVSKEKYWYFVEAPGQNELTLSPEGWIAVNVHRDGTYPAETNLVLSAIAETGRTGDATITQLPNTTLMVKAFGDDQNKLHWRVIDSNGQFLKEGEIEGLLVPKFDTLAVELRY